MSNFQKFPMETIKMETNIRIRAIEGEVVVGSNHPGKNNASGHMCLRVKVQLARQCIVLTLSKKMCWSCVCTLGLAWQ